MSLTRIGAGGQGFAKATSTAGAAPPAVLAGLPAGNMPTETDRAAPGVLVSRSAVQWLGSRGARDQAFVGVATTLAEIAEAAERQGGRLFPPGVAPVGGTPQPAGDGHALEVHSPVEQEVLCNLLRQHVPALIAMTGRGTAVPGRHVDRVGSRWLADSRSHLATRFLASTSPAHLERVKAELRRRDGVAQLERMDVTPGATRDGRPLVVVRCVDSAAGPAGLRAHALVLAGLGLHARRMVRDGRRARNVPQRWLQQNRARAVAAGMRARFVHVDRPDATTSAAEAIRGLLTLIAPELGNLGVTAAEIAPVVLALDLPRHGVRTATTERGLLDEWAGQGDAALAASCLDALTDPEPGGPLLREMKGRHAGLVDMVLRSWQELIERPAGDRGQGQR